jgi:hypothetical protein
VAQAPRLADPRFAAQRYAIADPGATAPDRGPQRLQQRLASLVIVRDEPRRERGRLRVAARRLFELALQVRTGGR